MLAVDYSTVQSCAICSFKEKTLTEFLPAYEESFESQTFSYVVEPCHTKNNAQSNTFTNKVASINTITSHDCFEII